MSQSMTAQRVIWRVTDCSSVATMSRTSYPSFYRAPQSFPIFVDAPHQRRQPRPATLDQRDPQARKAVENALDDQAQHLRLEHLGHADVLLDVVRRPTRARRRIARRAAELQAHD